MIRFLEEYTTDNPDLQYIKDECINILRYMETAVPIPSLDDTGPVAEQYYIFRNIALVVYDFHRLISHHLPPNYIDKMKKDIEYIKSEYGRVINIMKHNELDTLERLGHDISIERSALDPLC